MLLIGNHPNDLPDVLAGFFTTDRSVRYVATISATTMPMATATYRGLGVIPVMRVRDVRKMRERGVDVAAVNRAAFGAVTSALQAGEVIGVFPEGGVHDTPRIGRPRAGVASMALDALDNGAKSDVRVVPFGVQYDAGQRPRSDLTVVIGKPQSLRAWVQDTPADASAALASKLTSHLQELLQTVSRNNDSWHDAAQRDRLIAAVAPLLATSPNVLATAATIQHRCAELTVAAYTGEPVSPDIVRCLTIANDLAAATELAGGLSTSPRDLARMLDAADTAEAPGTSLAAADWPASGYVIVAAAPAIIGLVLHAPLWGLVRLVARRLVEVRTDFAAKAIVPGLHLIFLGYLLLGALAALACRAAGWSVWWVLPVVFLLPRLGDLALSWLDAVRALRLRRTVRGWPAAQRAELVQAAQELRHLWDAVA